MNGIDIYNGSEITDWNAIKAAGVQYVYLKATEGLTFNDSKMREFYNSAKSAGLKVGFYHFLRRNNPYQEAEHFINMTAGLQADMKYMIDVEAQEFQSSGANDTSTRVRQFYDYMASKGYECGIYTYSSFYNELFDSRVKDLPLWVAEYGVSSPRVSKYIGWQYSETGNVPGVSGNCDINNFSEGILLGNSTTLKVVAEPTQQSEDDTIKTIQQQLNTLLKCNLDVDAKEGPLTIAEMENFQKAMGLQADHVWGSKTVAAVTEIFSKPEDSKEAPHYEYATRYIQYRVGSGGDKPGYFSNGTKLCLQNWQAAHGLDTDGVAGTATWSKLLDENC